MFLAETFFDFDFLKVEIIRYSIIFQKFPSQKLHFISYFICFLIVGSQDYEDSVEDIKYFFPAGLSCKSNTDLESEQVKYL